MLETMYELPSQTDIKECVITEGVILGRERPILVYEKQAAS